MLKTTCLYSPEGKRDGLVKRCSTKGVPLLFKIIFCHIFFCLLLVIDHSANELELKLKNKNKALKHSKYGTLEADMYIPGP